MPFCPYCRGMGTSKNTYKNVCPDCDGKGLISDNELKFIEFYNNKKKIEKEIQRLEREQIRIEAEKLI